MLTALVLVFSIAVLYQNCQQSGERNSKSDRLAVLSSATNELSAAETRQLKATAHLIYQRLTGTKSADSSNVIEEMTTFLASGDVDAAVDLALNDDDFYNITIRDMAAEMSNREETPVVALNDFISTFIGVVRDGLDAKTLLTGKFFYSGPGLNSQNVAETALTSNQHYQQLDDQFANLAQTLVQQDQQLYVRDGQPAALEDTAGVITSRAFMKAHANMGTNRRLVQFAFRQFLCKPISDWASTAYPDNRVGRDVGRSPIQEYRNKCVACHAPMDALRPAFAHFDFSTGSMGDGQIFYRQITSVDPREDDPTVVDVPVPADEQLVPSKFRRGSGVFPEGFAVRNDSWENYTSTNESFGWRTSATGQGVNQLADMMANSRAFSQCMVKRAFRAVCLRPIDDKEVGLQDHLVQTFESGYQFRELFAEIIKQPECTGVQL